MPDRPTKPWQVRLAPQEDAAAARLAKARSVSKNDVVRRAIRLLDHLDREVEAGSRMILERPGSGREPVEVWLLW